MNIDVEVSQARTELLFLEEKARGLLKQFFDVRAAIDLRRSALKLIISFDENQLPSIIFQ